MMMMMMMINVKKNLETIPGKQATDYYKIRKVLQSET